MRRAVKMQAGLGAGAQQGAGGPDPALLVGGRGCFPFRKKAVTTLPPRPLEDMTLWLATAPESDLLENRPLIDTLRSMSHAKIEDTGSEDIEALLRQERYRSAAIAINRMHRHALGRLAMAMLGNQAEADDSVQETLLQVVQSLTSYRGDGTVRAWVFGIARRVCAKRLEVRIRQDARRHLATDSDVAESPHANLERDQECRRVRAVLQHLRPTEREALLLRYEVDLSYAEIASACGIDEVAARKRVSRALLTMRDLLARDHGGSR